MSTVLETIDRLLREKSALCTEIDRLQREAAVNESFYNLALKERDLEREKRRGCEQQLRWLQT